MEPRPLRHLHFLTEKAIHSEDDAKKTLFIDSVRNDENYPGSSLFESHQNVRESIDKYKDTFQYSVDTISLSTLMKQTLSYFKEEEITEAKSGNSTKTEAKTEAKTKEKTEEKTEAKTEEKTEEKKFDEEAKTMESLSKQHLVSSVFITLGKPFFNSNVFVTY